MNAVLLTEYPDRAEFSAKKIPRAVMLDHVKQAIAPYKYPRSIKFIEALPKTATGKIQRFKLRGGG